jgi:hypothetical protein
MKRLCAFFVMISLANIGMSQDVSTLQAPTPMINQSVSPAVTPVVPPKRVGLMVQPYETMVSPFRVAGCLITFAVTGGGRNHSGGW